MTETRPIEFGSLRDLLVSLGYRHDHVDRGEVFHQTDDREIYFRRYGDGELVNPHDVVKARRFLDAWGQLDAADFDAFLESKTRPA
jgi:hypothetical protein